MSLTAPAGQVTPLWLPRGPRPLTLNSSLLCPAISIYLCHFLARVSSYSSHSPHLFLFKILSFFGLLFLSPFHLCIPSSIHRHPPRYWYNWWDICSSPACQSAVLRSVKVLVPAQHIQIQNQPAPYPTTLRHWMGRRKPWLPVWGHQCSAASHPQVIYAFRCSSRHSYFSSIKNNWCITPE